MAICDDLEYAILAVFQVVMAIDSISVEDDFFTLGGNSRQAVEIASKLSLALDRDIDPSAILLYPIIKELAESMSNPDF